MRAWKSILLFAFALAFLWGGTAQAQRQAAQQAAISQEAMSALGPANQGVPGRDRAIPSTQQLRPSLATVVANLPLNFEANVGQTDGKVQFISHGKGYTLFLTPTEAVFALHVGTHPLRNEKRLGKRFIREQALKSSRRTTVLRMKLVGVNSGAHVTGVGPMTSTANYFLGRDPSNWHTGVPLYSRVQYSEVFPGIDLDYYGNQRQLEYDFVVKPGANPKSISFGFEGTKGTSVDGAGNLAMATEIGAMKLNKPIVYQMDRGQRKQVEGKYVLRGPDLVGVDVTDYDRTQPLIIDPVLTYSTYLGGSGDDGIYDLAVDSQGNAYVTGWTDSDDFPIEGNSLTPPPNGTYVAFAAKLNATGTALVYSTYLGGTGGDFGSGIALDANGYVYVTGDTGSTDFPVTTSNAFQKTLGAGASQNAFVSKLSPDGQSLSYSTYLGGGAADGGYAIAVDANQNVYVDGLTTSGSPEPFPATPNAFQTTLKSQNGNGFVARIDTTKSDASSLVYSTYLGGSISTFNDWDQACGIAVDANQNVYVTGMASSSDFPVTPTAYQTAVNQNGNAFLTQIDTTKSGSAGLIYSTIFGGTGSTDQGSSVTLDSTGKVYLTGGTGSGNFPVTTGVANSGPGKAFVAKFDTTKSQAASLAYSTLVGGSSGEFSYRVVVDPNGNGYISGWTWSSDFPVTPDAIQSTLGAGGQNSFVVALSPDASRVLFATYLGGSGGRDDFAPGLALDQNYDIYVAGATQSANFQTTSGAFQASLNGTSDAFVAKLTALAVPIISSVSPNSGVNGSTVTISGKNFGATQGTSTVTFNGVTAPVTSWSATSITVTVPSGATTGNIVVTVGGGSQQRVSVHGADAHDNHAGVVTEPLDLLPGDGDVHGDGDAFGSHGNSHVQGWIDEPGHRHDQQWRGDV